MNLETQLTNTIHKNQNKKCNINIPHGPGRHVAYRIPPHLPLDLFHVSLRPILPKQRQLQNSTLSIHTPVSTVSCVAKPPNARGSLLKGFEELRVGNPAGAGIISGSTPRRRIEPVKPTAADSTNPGLLRSMSHHKRGLTNANVADT